MSASGWLTQGPRTVEFERLIADYLGVPEAVATDNCTTSLQLALEMMGVRAGDEVPVFAVDPHVEAVDVFGWTVDPDDRAIFLQNLLRFEVTDIVRPISLPSERACKAWDGEISMLWIDGDHTYEATKIDFKGWSRFVPSGGLVLFHDANDPEIGPFQVIGEILEAGGYRELLGINSLRVLQKVAAGA